MLVPDWIQIELSGICSLKCNWCAYKYRRKEHNVFMDYNMALKALDQIKELNSNPRIELAHFGESTLYPEFIEIIEELENRNFIRGCVITNASHLNYDLSKKIVLSEAIEEIVFSIYGYNDKDFYKFTGVGGMFDIIQKNIFAFLSICFAYEWERENPLKITFSIISHSDSSELTFGFWKELICGINHSRRYINDGLFLEDRVWYCQVDSRAGTIDFPEEESNKWCEHLKELIVFANGDVSYCCMNCLHEGILGNINDNTLYKIWNSEKAELIRRDYVNGRQNLVPLCNHCPVKIPNEPAPDWLEEYKECLV